MPKLGDIIPVQDSEANRKCPTISWASRSSLTSEGYQPSTSALTPWQVWPVVIEETSLTHRDCCLVHTSLHIFSGITFIRSRRSLGEAQFPPLCSCNEIATAISGTSQAFYLSKRIILSFVALWSDAKCLMAKMWYRSVYCLLLERVLLLLYRQAWVWTSKSWEKTIWCYTLRCHFFYHPRRQLLYNLSVTR